MLIMIGIDVLIFVSLSLIIRLFDSFEEDKFQDWLRYWRLDIDQSSAHEEATLTFEETVEIFFDADSTIDRANVSVMLLDSDVLDCPTCGKPLNIPIFQCTNNSHIDCSSCCIKVKNKCISCKLPIGLGNRCRAIGKVIEATRVLCPKEEYENASSHEKECLCAPCSCPIRDCNYTALAKDLYNHVRVKHEYKLIQFRWHISFVFHYWSLRRKTVAFFQEEIDGEVIVVQVFRGPQGLTLSMSCIAPLAPKLGDYSCSVKFGTNDIRLEHSLMVKKIQKMSDEYPQDDFILIPSYRLPRDGSLEMDICISPGERNVLKGESDREYKGK